MALRFPDEVSMGMIDGVAQRRHLVGVVLASFASVLDWRAKPNADFVVASLQGVPDIEIVLPVHVPAGADYLVVDENSRNGIETLTDERDPLVIKNVFIHRDGSTIFPVSLPDPLDIEFIVVFEGIVDLAGSEQVPVHPTRNVRRSAVVST
jgi:hypothetical protein